jgi:hypothetical protein
MANQIKEAVFKIALPWALSALGNALGLKSWLKNRALRVPSERLQDAVDAANDTLHAQDPGAPSLSMEQWRAVEATQAQLVTDGIKVAIK